MPIIKNEIKMGINATELFLFRLHKYMYILKY